MEIEENWPPLTLAVVSPPLAPNLTSLLTGHTGQEVGPQAIDEGTALDKNNHSQENEQVEDNLKSPIKKKSKKSKTTTDDKPAKHDRSGSSLKKSSYANATKVVGTTPSTKDYNFERVFYEAELELKGEDKYSAYVKNIGNLIENIQLVDLLAIMHAVDESGGAKPLGSKTEMSTNMTAAVTALLSHSWQRQHSLSLLSCVGGGNSTLSLSQRRHSLFTRGGSGDGTLSLLCRQRRRHLSTRGGSGDGTLSLSLLAAATALSLSLSLSSFPLSLVAAAAAVTALLSHFWQWQWRQSLSLLSCVGSGDDSLSLSLGGGTLSLLTAAAVMALSLSRVGSSDGTLSLLAATALSLYSQRKR